MAPKDRVYIKSDDVFNISTKRAQKLLGESGHKKKSIKRSSGKYTALLPSVKPKKYSWDTPTIERIFCIKCLVTVQLGQFCQSRLCKLCCCENAASQCLVHTNIDMRMDYLVNICKKNGDLYLDLSYNKLLKAPVMLSQCHTLVSLNLSNNNIQVLPHDIGACTILQELFLQYNLLTCLPDSICNLTELTELELKNNRLRLLPLNIGYLRKLTVLVLTNNMLTILPDSIRGLAQLEEFSVHSNLLVHLPDSLTDLSQLKTLYLGQNPLRSLPFHIGRLLNLQDIDVSGITCTAGVPAF